MANKAEENEFRRMTIGEHLEELRSRVLWSIGYVALALVLVLIFNNRIMGFVLAQPASVLQDLGNSGIPFKALAPTEAFLSWLKLAVIVAIVLASPMIARELWGFVAAGLYPNERKYVQLFGPISYLLFLGGVAFLYFLVMPVALKFLLGFQVTGEIPGVEGPVVDTAPQLSKYLSFYITMSLLMGLVFQLPLVMLFFMATGILSPAFFRKHRRHFIVGAVAALAVLSPTGDAPTLILISAPVLLLYEIGILLGRILAKKDEEAA